MSDALFIPQNEAQFQRYIRHAENRITSAPKALNN